MSLSLETQSSCLESVHCEVAMCPGVPTLEVGVPDAVSVGLVAAMVVGVVIGLALPITFNVDSATCVEPIVLVGAIEIFAEKDAFSCYVSAVMSQLLWSSCGTK